MSDFNFEEYSNSMAMPVEEFEKISLKNRLATSTDPEERKRIWDWLESRGFVAPEENNPFVEAGEAFAKSFINSIRWTNEDYFCSVLERNQQWNAPKNCSAVTDVARGIGSFLGFSWIIWGILLLCLCIKYCRVMKKHIKLERNTISEDKKDAFYAMALDELENNQIDKATWAKALESGSSEEQNKSIYIKLRVKKLTKEFMIEQKKTPQV